MSAVLTVTKDKKQVAKVAVTGSAFVIGRAPECNLPLDEALASRQHAEIVFESGAYWVRDRGSRNGTSVNGEKITGSRELKDGDEIEIGSTRMKFIWDKSRQEEEDDEDKTRVASIADLGKKAPGQQVMQKKDRGNIEVKLRVVDGPLQGGVFQNWESPLTIGRGLDNHVVLLDDAVSTAHAQIVQEGDNYFVVDLKSSNGTFLDGIKVQKTQLHSGGKIKVGVSTLVFDMVDLRKKRKNMKIILISLVSIIVIALLAMVFKPKDVAGQHIATAQNYAQQGEWDKALEEYQMALKVDPNRAEAKRGVAGVKQELQALELLTMAAQAAVEENYDKANELCYRVLRDFPKNSRALELQAVIKTIVNAKIAFDARNWGDAKQLLEKAQETYPKSELIHVRLQQAQNELMAEQKLSQAKDALQHQQMDMAEPMLKSIPTNSVYFTEAREKLGQIIQSRQIADYLNKAQAFYRDGRITDALAGIEAGLQQAAGNSQLLNLQKRIRQMEALVKPLEAAEALSQPDNVEALLQYQKTCNDVINLEDDPLNAMRKRAQAAGTRIAEKLQAVSQADASQAADALQAGNRKESLRLYDLAVKANPNNQGIVGQRDKLYQQIVADCRDLYQKGIVHEDLGQSDMARESYKQVLAIGIPGEDYYKKAADKLKAMGQ
jgi:pSer/pThr/pTyr-binding forkhead associated (FHA) protein/tetratricopeptide (TPR) repeat protein